MSYESSNARAVTNGKLQSSRYPTQQRLVAAIRRGEEPAMHELFVLYAPLLRDQAKKMSVPIGERNQLVDTVLDDVLLHLVDVTIPPRELTSYIVGALRNRVRSGLRDSQRARSNDEGRYHQYGDTDERIVGECHSEYGLRASRSADADEESPLRSAIKKLADKSAAALSADELVLMVGVSREIPVRDLAEQLDLNYVAARVKISRLRERFTRLAVRYVETLALAERREIERFFRRADVRLTASSHSNSSAIGRSEDEVR